MSVSILRLGMVSAVLTWAGSALAADPPRYALEPGQVLTYQEDQVFKGRGENSQSGTETRLWVVGRNDDGSWRVVARSTMEQRSQGLRVGDSLPTYARFDVHPD